MHTKTYKDRQRQKKEQLILTRYFVNLKNSRWTIFVWVCLNKDIFYRDNIMTKIRQRDRQRKREEGRKTDKDGETEKERERKTEKERETERKTEK
jgi:hypothetical protein